MMTAKISKQSLPVLLCSCFWLSACGAENGQPASVDSLFTGGDAATHVVGSDADSGPPSKPGAAKVYLHDPTTDNNQTSEVILTPPTTDDGTLIGPYASVNNCLNETGGLSMESLGFTFGALCKETPTVKPGPDGSYLHVLPPEDTSDPNDGFAEVMMYHHIHAIHDYFKGTHGLTDLDYPLPALVNLNLWFDPEVAAKQGLEGGWVGYPNAAFMPPKGFTNFQLPEREEGYIIFGQYKDLDLSYDATVIYHEYTHAMVGTTRLSGLFADKHGLNNEPGAMNEAFADYFAATMLNHPVIGTYGIAFAGDHLVRDLAVTRRCPEDLTTEIHADGRIFASALWAIRQQVGAGFADSVFLRALQGFTNSTGFEAAALAIVAEAELEDFDRSEQMLLIFKKQGIVGCLRATELQTWQAQNDKDKARFTIEGSKRVGGTFSYGVPAYKQWKLGVPFGTTAVTIRWRAESKGSLNNPNLRLYIAHDEPVLIATTVGGGISAAGFATPEPDPTQKGWQSITLSGACLPKVGTAWMLLTNFGVEPAQIDEIEVKTHQVVPAKDVNLALCKP